MNRCRLLADIGGTNARFARSLPDGEIFAKQNYKVADFIDFDSALQRYRADTGSLEACEACVIAAAGPVFGEQLKLTNADWQLNAGEISRALNNIPTHLYNDLEAVALALPHLESADIEPIGDIHNLPEQRQRMLALNVGTGFGAAMTIRCGRGWITCPSEAGHMGFVAQDVAGFGLPVSGGDIGITVEDILSGAGLMRIYQAQCLELGSEISASTADEVFARVSDDISAQETLNIFTGWLGRVTHNLALASASWGGVFMTGGVIQGWRSVASHSQFRKNFELEGKMQALMKQTFVAVITREDISFYGLARASID